MKVLTKSECNAWLASHNIESEGDERLALPPQGYSKWFETPQTSRFQLVLAHGLAAWFNYPKAFFWMSTWPHYETQEMELFLQWRQNHGDESVLIEAPGHLFNIEDKASAWVMGELLLFAMAFNWEGYLLQPEQRSVIWIGDDIIGIITQEQNKDKDLQELLDALCIKHEDTMITWT